MQDNFSFGRWVKHLRHSRGLTQDVLAERVGCATQTIRKIEGGKRRPSYQMAERLADMLDLPSEERAAFMQAARGPDDFAPRFPPEVQPTSVRLLNFPVYLTPFLGREQEQAELARLLAAPGYRLITLLGPGGIGKTRLAVEVAGQCMVFSDGVVFVPLAPINEPHAIVPAIADALAFTFSGTTDLSSQLLNHLRDKELLIVLDNMEHLLGAEDITVELVGQILAQAPHVKVLTTSRERLKMQAEWVVEVEGLPVPPDDPPQKMADFPAFTLFLEHAKRVQNGFQLLAGDEQAVTQICRAVGGMPLGLELAASWVRVLSPHEIGQEIIRGLDAPPVAPQDLPKRHRSLQAVFDHSWRLLSDAEGRVLRKLAIFRGGCTREAAADVAGASLTVLATLVDKSLLRRTRHGRYEMHELIRQYALSKLREDSQEYTATRDQHSAYYAGWLKERERPLKGALQAAMVAEMRLEIDNVRAAWEWAVERGRLRDIQRSSEALHWYCEFQSWFREGETLFQHATERLSRLSPVSGPPGDVQAANGEAEQGQVLGQVLADQGYVASRLGKFDQAL
ncbi:MAG: helix-turn-helix domain-containing protein, partial [Chloroflexota bacterium]|nr:helix-turn-helix domain-containing protein [Chloroflexota bacterium]